MKKQLQNLQFFTLCLSVSLLLVNVGCKKEEDKTPDGPTAGCRIIKLQTPGEPDLTIDYNTKGQINTIADGNYIKSYTYEGNNWTITKAVAGNLVEKTVVKNNADGLAYDVRIQHDAVGASWTQYNFFYNGQQLTSQTTEDNNGNRDTAWMAWKDNNLIRIYTRADTTEVSYYNDQNYKMGDAWKTSQMFDDGYEVVRNTNLVKMVRLGSYVLNYSYAFDAQGVITSVTAVDPATKTTTYTWTCD